MLTIQGSRERYCDGVSRRSFLKIGGLALGGLSLADVLRAQAQSGTRSPQKAVIMIFLSGGPPHQDMFDLKPEAPREIRGEFEPIATCVPGIEICELLPGIAQRMDKLALIRSIVGSEGRHAAFQCQTGRGFASQAPGGWPSLGSAVSRIQGAIRPDVPAFVGLAPGMKTRGWSDPGAPGFLGPAHSPFTPNAGGHLADLVLDGITLGELADRKSLLGRFDRLRRAVDAAGAMEGLDQFYQQAYGILTSGDLAAALDVEREDPKTRDRFGRGSIQPAGYGDAGPLLNDYFLVARRLVEVGVRCVTLAYGRWDWHGRPHGTNFENARDHLPMLDLALGALLDDLAERSLLDDVSIVVWGEFGRTPKINRNGGRDHWPQVSCALLAGGGMRTGQVIGSTNRLGEYAQDRPVHFQEVFATLYHNLGIDVGRVTLPDLAGRPQYLVDHHSPIPEVV